MVTSGMWDVVCVNEGELTPHVTLYDQVNDCVYTWCRVCNRRATLKSGGIVDWYRKELGIEQGTKQDRNNERGQK